MLRQYFLDLAGKWIMYAIMQKQIHDIKKFFIAHLPGHIYIKKPQNISFSFHQIDNPTIW